jgi:hypothetical protein
MASPLKFISTLESSSTITLDLPFSPVFDMLNTEIVYGIHGEALNNGGIPRNEAVTGGNNTQKTGVCVLSIARVLYRVDGSIAIVNDIEDNFKVSRLADAVDKEFGIPGYFEEHINGKRFFYFSKSDIKNPCDGNFVKAKFREINAAVREQLAAGEDIFVKTPVVDEKKQPIKIIVPILIVTDSISEMHFGKISQHFQEGDVDEGGEKRTRDLSIGNARRIVHEDADVLGSVCGIYQIWVAQITEKINLTGRPEEKESVFIRPGRKLKGPRSLLRIPQIAHEIIKGSLLKEGNEWLYPNPFGRDVELNSDSKEVPDLMHYANQPYRNKAGMSGIMSFFIGSQSMGIQEGLTMYHALKSSKYFGLDGSKISHWSTLYPECKVGRTTVWAKTLEDPKFVRALTIIYHLWFMRTFWFKLPLHYRLTPQELYDKIKARGLDWNDILENTVDYWFTNPSIKKHTVTTFELVRIALGERDPYWIKDYKDPAKKADK